MLTFDPRSPSAILQITNVFAFMFGNRVPLPIACRFFAACSFMPLPIFHDQFFYLYGDWSLCPKKFPFYDVCEKRWKYTDNTYVADMAPPVVGLPTGSPPSPAAFYSRLTGWSGQWRKTNRPLLSGILIALFFFF
jgi:hypothetical protein